MWRRGGIASLVCKLGTGERGRSSSYPGRFTAEGVP